MTAALDDYVTNIVWYISIGIANKAVAAKLRTSQATVFKLRESCSFQLRDYSPPKSLYLQQLRMAVIRTLISLREQFISVQSILK